MFFSPDPLSGRDRDPGNPIPWARYLSRVVALVAMFTAATCESAAWGVVAFVATVLTIVF